MILYAGDFMRKSKVVILIIILSLIYTLAACKSTGEPSTPLGSQKTLEQAASSSAITKSSSYSTSEKTDINSNTGAVNPNTGNITSNNSSAVTPAASKKAEELYQQGFQTYMDWKLDDAILLFDRAINTDPACFKAYNGKGIVLCFKGDYKNGMSLIDKALDMKPDYVYANFNKALGYKIQKDFDNAMLWFNKALSLDPSDTWSYYGIACIYAERKDAKNAVIYLEKAIDIDPAVKESAKTEHDLDPVRNDPSFIELLK